jgi:hypothetical protein
MSRLSAFLLATGLLTTASASAQESPQVGLAGVRSGQVIKFRTSQGQLLEGRFSTSPARDATLQLTDRDLPLTDTAIDSLWVHGNRAGIGALIGGLVFGAASAVVWNEVCKIGTEGQPCDETAKVFALSLAGAALGAGFGALMGSHVGTWRLKYARPGASLRLSPVSLNRIWLGVTLPL